MSEKVLLSEDLEAQKKFLDGVKDKIEVVLSSIVGYRVRLILEENKSYGSTYLVLKDCKDDWQKCCGAMRHCFNKVELTSWNIWWNDEQDNCFIQFNFSYELREHGTNGMEVCKLEVNRDGFIKNYSFD